VYTQHHFAVDSVAGIVFALWINLLVVPVLVRFGRSHYPISDTH
jgi:hypothetical protein